MSGYELLQGLERIEAHEDGVRRDAAVRELRFLLKCGLGPDVVVARRPDLTDLLLAVMTGLVVESIEGVFIKQGETLEVGRRRAIAEAMENLNNDGIASMKVMAPVAKSIPSDYLSKAVGRELEYMSLKS